MSKAKSSKKIDWNDPFVLRYHTLNLKPKTVAQARKNMIKYLKNQGNYKIKDFKGMSYNEIRPIFEKVWDFNQHIEPMDSEHVSEKEKEEVKPEQVMKEVSKMSGGNKKKSLPRKSTRGTVKKQKMEEDAEKEDLKGYFDIVPREDVVVDVDFLSTKYPIMDWKTYVLSETFVYYQIFRGDGSSKNYKMLWTYTAIHMLIEKKYPLSQEMLSKILSKRLEVDHESSQAFELLRFIRSQVQK
ncbi:hypothetical protein Tco_0061573 [Tanacetum coccineum]